jgi:hypothetical protein
MFCKLILEEALIEVSASVWSSSSLCTVLLFWSLIFPYGHGSNRGRAGTEVTHTYKDDDELQRILNEEWNKPILPNKPPWRVFVLEKRAEVTTSTSLLNEDSGSSTPHQSNAGCSPGCEDEETTLAIKGHHGLGDGVSTCYAFFPTLFDYEQSKLRKMVTSVVTERLEKTNNGALAKKFGNGSSLNDPQTPLRVPTIIQIAIYVASFLLLPFSSVRYT